MCLYSSVQQDMVAFSICRRTKADQVQWPLSGLEDSPPSDTTESAFRCIGSPLVDRLALLSTTENVNGMICCFQELSDQVHIIHN